MADAARGLNEWSARFDRALQRGLDEVARRFTMEASDIISDDAIDEGTLLRSVETRKPSDMERIVAFTAKHAVFSEYGSRPHWPPLAPIKAWVRRNLAKTGAGFEFKAKTGRRVTNEEKIEQVARAVQAKIARDGTKPVAYARRAAALTRPHVRSIMLEALKEETS